MPFHRIARHRVLATGVPPSAAGDDLTACDAYVNHHEVLAVARQTRDGAVDVERGADGVSTRSDAFHRGDLQRNW